MRLILFFVIFCCTNFSILAQNFSNGIYVSMAFSNKISEEKQTAAVSWQHYKPSFFTGFRTEIKLKRAYFRTGVEAGIENTVKYGNKFIWPGIDGYTAPAEIQYSNVVINLPINLKYKACSGSPNFFFYSGFGLNPTIYKKSNAKSAVLINKKSEKIGATSGELSKFNSEEIFNITNFLNVNGLVGYQRKICESWALQLEFQPEFRVLRLQVFAPKSFFGNVYNTPPVIFRFNVALMNLK